MICNDISRKAHFWLFAKHFLFQTEFLQESRPLPVWSSLTEYLDYLQLDEPIIGLKHLVRVDSDGPDLKYLCRLCFAEGDLPSITFHVLGRRHRTFLLRPPMTDRPDLVTWDVNSRSQSGKLVRAKAEVVERQDGRGIPEMEKEINPFKTYHKGLSNRGQEYIKEDDYGRSYQKEDHDGHFRPSNSDRASHRPRGPGPQLFGPSYKEKYPLKQNYREEESYDHRLPHKMLASLKEEWCSRNTETDRSRQTHLEQQEDRQRKEKEYKLLQLLRSQIQKLPQDDFSPGDAHNDGERIDFPRDSHHELGYGKESRTPPFEWKEGRNYVYGRDTRRRPQYDRQQQGRGERSRYSRDIFSGDDAGPSREPNDHPRKRMRLDSFPQHQVVLRGGGKSLCY
uniref:Uncharacterized LOC108933275 n=1 Tax=Scleropages formosus TaxID=113540 RepID=A0A8C9RS70_SCLFO